MNQIQGIREAVEKAESIVIMAHDREDADALGSIFAMTAMLRSRGKKAECLISGPVEKRLLFMDGSYQIYQNEQKPYALCICIDCGSADRLGKRIPIFQQAEATINIDHHATNTEFADVNLVDSKAAASGQILYRLFQELGWELNDQAAAFLYTAIASDTGGFKYSNTTCETMEIAALLLRYHFDHAEIMRRVFDCMDLKILKLRGAVMNQIKSCAGGKISYVRIEEDLLRQYGVAEEDATDFVDIPRVAAGTEIAAELKVREGKIRVSLRSNGPANVAEIAAGFGGGGHIRAAGATLNFKTMDEAEKAVLAECEKALKKAGL